MAEPNFSWIYIIIFLAIPLARIIQVGYCKFTKLGNSPHNDMVAIIKGKTAIEIAIKIIPVGI